MRWVYKWKHSQNALKILFAPIVAQKFWVMDTQTIAQIVYIRAMLIICRATVQATVAVWWHQ